MRTKQTARCQPYGADGAGGPGERGAALVTAIFGLLLITLLGLALTFIGKISLTISTNNQQTSEAFYIADSGLTHAVSLIEAVPAAQWSAQVLQAGDNTANTGDELSARPTDPIPAGGTVFGEGRYVVRVTDDVDANADLRVDTNRRIIVTAIGVGRDGSTATVEAAVESAAAPAILVGGKLRINGNPHVTGQGGIIHANDTLDFDGNPCAEQYFSSATNIIDPSNANSGPGCTYSGGNVRASQQTIPVPVYNLATLRPLADYILTADGKVRNASGGLIHDATTTGNEWVHGADKWKWEGSGNMKWVLDTDTLSNGTYFSDVNMQIPKNPGLSGPVPQVTLLAVGYIQVNGNPRFTAKLTYQGIPLSMVAGMDIEVNGNPVSGVNYQGRIWAGHQVKFNGNPDIQGQVIAANLADTPGAGGVSLNLVPLLSGGYMEISGNATISYDGGWDSSFRIARWREIRN